MLDRLSCTGCYLSSYVQKQLTLYVCMYVCIYVCVYVCMFVCILILSWTELRLQNKGQGAYDT
jgi:hypothetical protein